MYLAQFICIAFHKVPIYIKCCCCCFEVHRKEQNQLQDRKRDLKKRESEVEDLRSKNETEQNRLNRWHADLDTREKVIS